MEINRIATVAMALVAGTTAEHSSPSKLPSFLMILADDIG